MGQTQSSTFCASLAPSRPAQLLGLPVSTLSRKSQAQRHVPSNSEITKDRASETQKGRGDNFEATKECPSDGLEVDKQFVCQLSKKKKQGTIFDPSWLCKSPQWQPTGGLFHARTTNRSWDNGGQGSRLNQAAMN